jgi:type II secretory pathway component PulF
MPHFSYQAIEGNGNPVKGVIEAASSDMAEQLLTDRGYVPLRISQGKTAGQATLFSRIQDRLDRVSAPDLILFTKQFRSMLQAGVPILRLLQVLEAQTQNRALKRASAAIGEQIKQGTTLYDALAKHPAIFSTLYLSMIRAGEISGAMPEVMTRLISIIDHEDKIRSDIKSAMRYPLIVMSALGIAFVVLLTFVIPKFVTIFARTGLELPLPTKIAMMLYQFMHNHWLLIIGVLTTLIIGLRIYVKTPQGLYAKDALIMRLPLVGPLFIKAAMSRFASIFAILQASGVPVMTSLSVLSGTIGNSAISREFEHVKEQVEQGQGIAAPLRRTKYFTPMVVDMVAIGEESGNIDEMLHVISDHYDDEVAYAVKRLSDAIGPLLVVGLAAVVGFFALAIYMPMWDMTKMVK